MHNERIFISKMDWMARIYGDALAVFFCFVLQITRFNGRIAVFVDPKTWSHRKGDGQT